jgi:peroxiredoxin (alkyl hydroperoxide reductase subunit C)
MIGAPTLYFSRAQEAPPTNRITGVFIMLTVGDRFPQFNLKATVSTESVEKAFFPIANDTYKGKWLCMFFYPKDFTFVCPTEIKGFGDLNQQFEDRDCQVLAASTDSEFVHLAWRKDHKDLRDLPFPMLADTAKRLSSALGILDAEEGVAKRATFLVDPDGIIRFAYVTEGSVGRNPQEVLRVLDALQTDELCPCNWQQGEQTLKAA